MLPEGFMFKFLDVMKMGLTYIDENQNVVYLNNEASELLQTDCGPMVENSVLNSHGQDIYQAVLRKIEYLRERPKGEWHKLVERNGRFLENYYSSVFVDGAYKGVVIATKDVTDREQMGTALRKSLDEMSVLFEAARLVNSSLNIKQVLDGVVKLAQNVVGFDAGGILLFDRETHGILYDAIYNYSPEEVANLKSCRPFGELLENLDEEYFVHPVEDHLTCSLVSQIEMAVPMLVNNEVYGVWFVENHQRDSFASDRKKMLVTLASLTSAALKNACLFERTMFAATIDQLTGLYNRQYFDHIFELEQEKAGLLQIPLSLIMVDLNRLKFINDNFGHEAGDYVIREAAGILKRSVRKGELVFRYGGDEMVILLTDHDIKQASKIAKRIKANAQKWNLVNEDKQIFVHISVGCATACDIETMDKLIALADDDMYRDKNEYYKALGLERNHGGPR